MQHNVAHVRSLLSVLIPMAAVMKKDLRLIDKLLSEQEESCEPGKAPRGEAELRRFGRGELSREGPTARDLSILGAANELMVRERL